mmetsp:Transcript_30509/g.64280  ORF Transcript_30509/g.64280 Transcript_30509/m.64280 type:complete len:80 (+) Transcript_30509:1114-1353(+)
MRVDPGAFRIKWNRLTNSLEWIPPRDDGSNAMLSSDGCLSKWDISYPGPDSILVAKEGSMMNLTVSQQQNNDAKSSKTQ